MGSRFQSFIRLLKSNPRRVRLFFVIFYLVGILGMLYGPTRDFFSQLNSFALIISFLAILVFHPKWDKTTISIFVFIWLAGFLTEVAGVKTGKIFGNYQYGESLGLKLFDTPLIIGMNWLLVTYMAASVVNRYITTSYIQVPVSALLMSGYDLLLEQLAPRLDFWSWQNDNIPVRNYVAWLVLGFVFQLVFRVARINTRNAVAPFILMVQIVFFVILFFTYSH